MRNILNLLVGEIKRFVSYKILPVSLVTSFIWIVIFWFLSKDDATNIAPLFIFVDVSMMSVLLVGASNHLERQDGTIKTMMVMPVSLSEILTSKIIASIFLGLESAVVASVGLFFIHGIIFNYALLLLFVVIGASAHVAIGFFLALKSKDFTSMLGLLMAYSFLFTIPTILFYFGIIDAKYEWILMLSPSHSANTLITSVVSGEYEGIKVILSSGYLVFLTTVLLRLAVYPKFKNNAVRG